MSYRRILAAGAVCVAAYFIFQSNGAVPAAVYEARDRCVKGACPPNVRSYGVYPTRWRQWSGAVLLPALPPPPPGKPEVVPAPKPDGATGGEAKPLEEDGAPALPKDLTKPEAPAGQAKPLDLPPSETPGNLPPSLTPNSTLPGGALPDTLLPPGLGPTEQGSKSILPEAPGTGSTLPGGPTEKKELTPPAGDSTPPPAGGSTTTPAPDDTKKPKEKTSKAAEAGKSASLDRLPELRAPENGASDLLTTSADSALTEPADSDGGKWIAPRSRADASETPVEMPGWEPSPFKAAGASKPLASTRAPARESAASSDSLRWGTSERRTNSDIMTVSGAAPSPSRKIEPSRLRANPLRAEKSASESRAAERATGANPLR